MKADRLKSVERKSETLHFITSRAHVSSVTRHKLLQFGRGTFAGQLYLTYIASSNNIIFWILSTSRNEKRIALILQEVTWSAHSSERLIFLQVYWSSRIHRLYLCMGRGYDLPHKECPVYDINKPEVEVPAIMELWGMRRTPLLI